MTASLTAPGAGRRGSGTRRGRWHRVRGWHGWPACSSGARVIGAGYLALSVLLVGCGLVITHLLAHSVGRWDDQVNGMFARHGTPTGNRITGYFTILANAPGIVAVAVVVSVVAALSRHARLAALLVIGLAVELAVFLTVNYAVGRPRPHVRHLGSTPSTYSWPSGHVGATFVLYGGIAVIITMTTKRFLPRILAWGLAAVFTCCVALARIYRGEHHPTDAMAGLLLGVGALATGVLAVRAWAGRARREEEPAGASAREAHGDEIGEVA